MAIKFSKEYEINYYDVDHNLKCKLPSIVNYLCDIGNGQSESIGDTIESLTENNSAWVFYKYDIKMKEYPKYRDVIKVETTPVGFNKFYAFRGYKISNSRGEIIGEALALFFLIDIAKRRPRRISMDQLKLYDSEDIANITIEMDKIRALEVVDASKEFNIRYSDIDSNEHVNNVKYIEWAIESVSIDIIKEYELKRVKVVFEKETTYGHKVIVDAQIINQDNNTITTIHRIYNDENKELTKLELDWGRE